MGPKRKDDKSLSLKPKRKKVKVLFEELNNDSTMEAAMRSQVVEYDDDMEEVSPQKQPESGRKHEVGESEGDVDDIGPMAGKRRMEADSDDDMEEVGSGGEDDGYTYLTRPTKDATNIDSQASEGDRLLHIRLDDDDGDAGDAEGESGTTTPRNQISREDRLLQIEMHKTHLLLLLANGIQRNRLCSAEFLQVGNNEP
eukprot:comp18950_c4_seq2/m.21208 comp18950_c4_seq2/g.21208  ORF comp18950_c4_seq2/g.21208 comp18950_c4_seq2/m.21208 type:complete len:198 (-) comp18950_c4_seq2:29-622(-)